VTDVVGVGEGVGSAVPVIEGVGVTVADGLCVNNIDVDGVMDIVKDGVTVSVGVLLCVMVVDGDGDGEGVMEMLGDIVGVRVSVGDAVGVGVNVGVTVSDGVIDVGLMGVAALMSNKLALPATASVKVTLIWLEFTIDTVSASISLYVPSEFN
jgi:hypothetical protein